MAHGQGRAARGTEATAWVTPRRLHDADSDAAALREGALPSDGLGRSVFCTAGFRTRDRPGVQLLGLGLGFKYISMIHKGCEQTLNSVHFPFIIVSVVGLGISRISR